jgi:hypothetical protein
MLSAACASTPTSAPVMNTPRVEFVAAPAGAANAPAGATTPPTVRVAQGRVEIGGQLTTPDPCFDLSAAFVDSNRELRVMVNAAKKPGLCATVIETFAYRATIVNLLPGDYSLEVVHVRPNAEPQTAVKQGITIK